jgi:hypothetical protein
MSMFSYIYYLVDPNGAVSFYSKEDEPVQEDCLPGARLFLAPDELTGEDLLALQDGDWLLEPPVHLLPYIHLIWEN